MFTRKHLRYVAPVLALLTSASVASAVACGPNVGFKLPTGYFPSHAYYGPAFCDGHDTYVLRDMRSIAVYLDKDESATFFGFDAAGNELCSRYPAITATSDNQIVYNNHLCDDMTVFKKYSVYITYP